MTSSKNQPLYRVKFCPKVGTDDTGRDQLGKTSVEIGAVWQRSDPSKGAILKLDIVPQDIQNGVLFLQPVKSQDRGFA